MLSAEALEICQKNYIGWQAKINGCDKCPIRDQCITNKPVRTEQELMQWREEINRAAINHFERNRNA